MSGEPAVSGEKVLVRVYGDSGPYSHYLEHDRNDPLMGDGFGDIIYREIDRETWDRYQAAKEVCDEIEALIDESPNISP